MSGITVETGTFETPDGVQKFSGIEINAMEVSDFYWLKWYVGRVDGENLIRTDICFPIHQDDKDAGGYAILFRYVYVNSHTDSLGAPQLASYGPLIGDWTEHEEWLVHLAFGLDRRQSDFSVLAVYGFYRTEKFDGSNEAVIMRLGVKYYF